LTHKKVNNADPGTATKFGGNDLDKWSDWASGVDTDDYDINSDITFRSGKRRLRNPANTFDYIETAGAITANRIVNEPVLTGLDTRVYQNHAQTLVNKTIDFDLNTLPNCPTGAEYTVYTAGANTKCRDNITGDIVSTSSTAPETPIRYAITNGLRKKIYVSAGTYNLSAAFTEFVIDVNQAEMLIEFSPGALISVPNGYAGNLFNHVDGASQAKLVGGRFNEAGTQQRLWNCYHYESGTANGVNTCTARDSYVRNAACAIKLETTGVTGATPIGWVNNCNFRDIFIDRSAIGIEFNMGATSFGMNRNVFNNVLIQSFGPTTTHGVKNLAGDGGEFYKVHVYDLDAGSMYATITSTAIDTLIIGGRMTSTNASQYTDNGLRTVVRDKWLKTWGRRGILSDTGTGAKLTFSTPHGLDRIPTFWTGSAANSNARASPFYVTADFTYVYFVLSSAPANGQTVSWSWEVSG
jgi:hypothetical protein